MTLTDIFDPHKRSLIMSRISGKETKPEILLRKFLFSKDFRYRKNVKSLPGKPDIVLAKYKTIIFVNGCFWHGHSCKAAKLPKTRREFWKNKITANVKRDSKNYLELKEMGYKIIIVWQCEIKNKKLLENKGVELIKMIKSES